MPGNTVPAVFAIPAANRPGFTGYFIPTPPSSYRNQAWMSYTGENELPSQWADSVRPLLDTLQGEKGREAETGCFVISPLFNQMADVSPLKGDMSGDR